ncbi:MAG: glycogen synthase [Chitinophagaceae bacterium]|jgi:starch synthase|nr:glycogen synthase [Chitinophagaceae bacterium]
MEIIHVSAECYPYAKAGGLGDVVGALPKYQNHLGHIAKVVMPMYRTKFLYDNEWELVHQGGQQFGLNWFHYSVIKEKSNKLGFDLFLVDINGLLDREKIYGYDDDAERFTAFQIAVCDWINHWQNKPDVIHCHDHHTGLIPFMMQYCFAFENLRNVSPVFTVHNAQYQGWLDWSHYHFVPTYDGWRWGLLEWDKKINPLASAIKCSKKVTTVSSSYLEELKVSANGLEKLFEYEQGKCVGILNGIDNDVWNPSTDEFIPENFDASTVTDGKLASKKELCNRFQLDVEKPLIVFIGRLVGEKAADILPEAIRSSIFEYNGNVNFLVLGSGEPEVESELNWLKLQFPGYVNIFIGYSEPLSHLMYAGADFLLMPSRVEPCGLNQMYALRYGTVPMVRSTGGLLDTVIDFGDWQGFGIRFNNATPEDVKHAVGRAIDLFYNKKNLLFWMREFMMNIDHSWDTSAKQYIELYEEL